MDSFVGYMLTSFLVIVMDIKWSSEGGSFILFDSSVVG